MRRTGVGPIEKAVMQAAGRRTVGKAMLLLKLGVSFDSQSIALGFSSGFHDALWLLQKEPELAIQIALAQAKAWRAQDGFPEREFDAEADLIANDFEDILATHKENQP